MEKYNVKFKKRLGQNFLKNKSIVERIVDVSGVSSDDLVIEVGPGGAILTKELASISKYVLAYEVDTDLKSELDTKLEKFNNVEVIYQDFLTSNISNDIKKYSYNKIFFISNVPYYITTSIIMKLIESGIHFENIVMMVQKEVGDRFSTKPGNREYGSITVLLNYFYNIKKEFFVSRKEFIPEPNVDSVIVSFREKKDNLNLKSFTFFEKVVRDSFQFKRKTIKNNLKKYNLEVVAEVLNKYEFDLSVRAEMLPVEVFVDLANCLYIK